MTQQAVAPYEVALQEYETERQELAKAATKLDVTNQEQFDAANALISRIKKLTKETEDGAKNFIAPYKEKIDFINGVKKLFLEPLINGQNRLIKKAGDWRRVENERAAKEQARLNALAQKRFDRQVAAGKTPDIPEPVAVIVQGAPKTSVTDEGKSSWVDHWSFVIDDPLLLPREYLMPDITKLNAQARVTKGDTKIPGGHPVNNPTPSVRG